MKYVLVSGGLYHLTFFPRLLGTHINIGVISGVGKGIIASSTGLLLKTIGLTVTSIVRSRGHEYIPNPQCQFAGAA